MAGLAPGAKVHVSLRPERVRLHESGAGGWQGTVERNVFVGTDVQTVVSLSQGTALMVRTQNSQSGRAHLFEPGAQVHLEIEPGAARLLAD